MKKKGVERQEDDVRPEYDLSKLKGRVCGKYWKQYQAGTNLALLAPDVRAAFPTDEALNEALRLLIKRTKAGLTAKRPRKSRKRPLEQTG